MIYIICVYFQKYSTPSTIKPPRRKLTSQRGQQETLMSLQPNKSPTINSNPANVSDPSRQAYTTQQDDRDCIDMKQPQSLLIIPPLLTAPPPPPPPFLPPPPPPPSLPPPNLSLLTNRSTNGLSKNTVENSRQPLSLDIKCLQDAKQQLKKRDVSNDRPSSQGEKYFLLIKYCPCVTSPR